MNFDNKEVEVVREDTNHGREYSIKNQKAMYFVTILITADYVMSNLIAIKKFVYDNL